MYCSVVVNRLKISCCCSCEGPECREAGKEPGVRQPLGMRRRQGAWGWSPGLCGDGTGGKSPRASAQPGASLMPCSG